MANRAPSGGLFPAGSWRPGDGAQSADKGFTAPGDSAAMAHPTWQDTFAGELRPRGNTQSADPTIRDTGNRRNTQLHPKSERNGPAGVVSVSRAYSNAGHTDTGRSVRILPSVHGGSDERRPRGGC